MQIVRSNPYPSLPVVQESPRQRNAAENPSQLLQAQPLESRRATRAIEDIRTAERMLNDRRSQNSKGEWVQEERQQRAIAAYRSLQQSDERDYVSEVLGIDVYA
jgi:hypothetical protein